MKKYELTDETIILDGCTLHRIRAARAFGNVREGDLGGFVESESNLSHDGDAWIFGDAWVYGDAVVAGSAKVFGDSRVFGDACVYGNARIYGFASVYGDARVSGNAEVFGDACAYENALVHGNAWVYGDALVSGNACVCGDARVGKTSDYMVFKNMWSSNRWFTYTASNKIWSVGCFLGSGEELIKKAYADSELSGKCYEAIVKAAEAIEAAKKEGEAK